MDTVSVNKFRDTLKDCVEKVISDHHPIKVTRRNGKDFVVVSAEDWEREQETLYILQNSSLMQQISKAMESHRQEEGYSPSSQEMDEILGI
ncbi:MAG: prevent-host-death protein [Leptolyngbya foveolarum]|uniref:Antitoxin n=1 Tax=Leptolyngbya foveolarum TaxID=47253 RepID=A0A2W4VG32_9CYAN|nr:MAG: prevent-host-death protein [Leptolyngbya foveolarum]